MNGDYQASPIKKIIAFIKLNERFEKILKPI